MKYSLILIVLLSSFAQGAELVRGAMTRHAMSDQYIQGGTYRKFNESNDLIGVSHGKYAVATMVNSYYNRSVLALYSPFNYQYLDLRVGFATGYAKVMPQYSFKGVTPVFSFGVKYKKVNISLFVLSAVVVTYGVDL